MPLKQNCLPAVINSTLQQHLSLWLAFLTNVQQGSALAFISWSTVAMHALTSVVFSVDLFHADVAHPSTITKPEDV